MSKQYIRITCTNCGFTNKAPLWSNQVKQNKFIKQCYNCDPKNINKKKDNKDDVNTHS